MEGPQKPKAKAKAKAASAEARDAWIAAAATRVLAASVHRHVGRAAYGLAWIARKKALEVVVERALPAGERAAEAEAALATAASSGSAKTSEAAAAAQEDAAGAYRRAAVWLKRSARAFERSARCDRAEAAQEERAARAYRMADLAKRGRAARRRAAEARRTRAISAESARRARDEAGAFRTAVDGPAAGGGGGLGGEGSLSRWLSVQAAEADVARQALAEAAEEAGKAAEARRASFEGIAHAMDTAKQEAEPAARASMEEAAGKRPAPDAEDGMQAWGEAMIAAGRALDAADDLDSLESGRGGRRRRRMGGGSPPRAAVDGGGNSRSGRVRTA